MHPSLDAVLSEFDPLATKSTSNSTSSTPPPISLPSLSNLSAGETIILKAENRRKEILSDLNRDPFASFDNNDTRRAESSKWKGEVEKGKAGVSLNRKLNDGSSGINGNGNRMGFNLPPQEKHARNDLQQRNQLIPTPAMIIPPSKPLAKNTMTSRTAAIHQVEFDETFFEEERIINLSSTSVEGGGWSDFISFGNSTKEQVREKEALRSSSPPLPELPKIEKSNGGGRDNWKAEWNYDSKSSTAIQPIKLVGVTPGLRKALQEDIAEGIRPSLPPRLRISQTWKLLYSLDQHGTSLKTMYECMDPILGEVDGGCVVVVKDIKGGIFGGFINEGFREARRHYGDGTCFLWKATPFPPSDFRIGNSIKTFTWTGKNDYYILTNQKIISIGGGNGKFGLWLDSDFLKGITANCPCFDNEPLTQEYGKGFGGNGEEESQFEVLQFEIWSVGGI